MSVVAAKGFRAAGAWAAIKGSGKPDLALVVSDRPAAAAGVFTANRFKAAPVVISQARLKSSGGRASAILATSGCANALTGPAGMRDALAISRCAARLLHLPPERILLASTGPIGTRLPVSRVMRGIRKAIRRLDASAASSLLAARGILTTDTKPKQAKGSFRDGAVRFSVGGIAKGTGMIAPRMATMLAFITTDAGLSAGRLRASLRRAADASFNQITVDGQMSTNDCVFLLANGAAGERLSAAGEKKFDQSLREVCEALAEQLVRDGEGARHLLEVIVRGARTAEDAKNAARSIADSPLVKTMIAGRQPNWGRLAQALGQCSARFDPKLVRIRVGGEPAIRGNRLIAPAFSVLTKLAEPKVRVEIDLRSGSRRTRIMTCDLTEQYVRINAGYLS